MVSISLIAVVAIFACAFDAQARSFRVSQIPNGSVNSCSNCHVNPGGGGTRNAFGQAVEAGLISSNVDWGSALASLDSDGDGFTNGQELQDPNGTWQTGQSAPGNTSLVSKPGSASSVPPATNSNPTLTSVGSKSVNEGNTLSFTLSASDPDGDSVSFSASGLPSGASLSGTAFTWTPGFSQSGSYTVTFTASDGEGGTDSESVSISVTDVNQEPQLSTIGNRTVNEDEALSFTVSATDADGDPVAISAVDLPPGATFSDDLFTWTPDFDQAGTYTVTFVAADDREGVVSEAVTITVEDQTPPAGPVTIDFDLVAGDQGRRRSGLAVAAQIYALQLNVSGAPEVDGWRVAIQFDAGQVRYIDGSFRPGGFISGLEVEVSAVDGLLALNGRAPEAGVASFGDGDLGVLSFEILPGFGGSTDLTIVQVEFFRVDDGADSRTVHSTASIVAASVQGLLAGDFDGTGVVDLEDFFLFADNFGGANPLYDLDRNGAVDLSDFFIFGDNFGRAAAAG